MEEEEATIKEEVVDVSESQSKCQEMHSNVRRITDLLMSEKVELLS